MSKISKKANAEAKRSLTQFIEYLQIPRTLDSVQQAALEIETQLHQKNRNSALQFSEFVEEQKLLKPLKLRWSCPVPYKTIVSSASDPDPILIGTAIYPHGYFCYEASLYLQGLLDLPKQVNIAQERTSPQKSISDFKYDDALLRKEFSKPPRITNRGATYEGYQYVLNEREYSNEVGIQKKWLSKKRMVEVKLSCHVTL